MPETTTNPLELLQRMAADPAFYRQQLRIEVSGEVRRYAAVAADWQEADFAAMDAAWLRCVGRSAADVKPMRSWLERPRGASKTGDLARMVEWGLRFAPRRWKAIWCAGDNDQARLGLKQIQQDNELNPWLGLQVQRNIVRNPETGSELEVISSDAATGYGLLADAVLIDEVSNWPNSDSAQHFWGVIASMLLKKLNLLCNVITNAGRLDSWQWKIREAIRKDDNWYFHALTVPPGWITEAQRAEQRLLLSPNQYSRSIDNLWTSGTDSGLSPRDVEACVVLEGPQLQRLSSYDCYVAGCDLGWHHDRTGLVVLAVSYSRGEVALAFAASWSPQDYGGEVPFDVVEFAIKQLHSRYCFDGVVFDPREATGLSQRLCDSGIRCGRMNLTRSEVQNNMAKFFLQAFNQRSVKLYRHEELIRDLLSIEVADRSFGLKLEAARTTGGHSDLAFAFAMALYALYEWQPAEPCEEVLRV